MRKVSNSSGADISQKQWLGPVGAAGAAVMVPAQDMFRGERIGTIEVPFGREWHLAIHKEHVTPKEIQRCFYGIQSQQ